MRWLAHKSLPTTHHLFWPLKYVTVHLFCPVSARGIDCVVAGFSAPNLITRRRSPTACSFWSEVDRAVPTTASIEHTSPTYDRKRPLDEEWIKLGKTRFVRSGVQSNLRAPIYSLVEMTAMHLFTRISSQSTAPSSRLHALFVGSVYKAHRLRRLNGYALALLGTMIKSPPIGGYFGSRHSIC